MSNKFELINSSKTPSLRDNHSLLDESLKISFSFNKSVKECKNELLRERFQTLIKNKGWSNHEFYLKTGFSRQYYHYISWGIWNPPLDVKIKIAKILGVDSALIWKEEALEK